MICSIGSFIFEAHEVVGQSTKITPHFGEVKPIGDNPHYHATQGYKKTVTINGRYIAESNSKPAVMESIAKAKRPVRFTTLSGHSMMAIATDFDENKKNFLPYSGAVNIDFTITITNAGSSGIGILGILGGLFALAT